MKEHHPGASSVDGKTLFELLRNALESGQQDDGDERGRLPDIGEDGGEHGSLRAGKPIQGGG